MSSSYSLDSRDELSRLYNLSLHNHLDNIRHNQYGHYNEINYQYDLGHPYHHHDEDCNCSPRDDDDDDDDDD
ncbi:hypothetical protein FRC01_005580 [Tulasnella sp. 417]|nr:hypothetical protein FRC01_005580 [Tulasnella sp. 417]